MRVEPLGEGRVVVGGQPVDEQAGVAADQGRGGLELPRLALDQRPAGVVQLGLRWAVGRRGRLDLVADVLERLGQPVGLQRGGDRERARPLAGNRTGCGRRR